MGIVVFWNIHSGWFVRKDKLAGPVIPSSGVGIAGYGPMYLDGAAVAIVTQTRKVPSNQSGEGATLQNLFGLLLTFGR